MGRRRYKLILAYDGQGFHGWQKQEPPGKQPLRTVAGVAERALAELLGQPINLVGASRTDAGVHARGQTAQFDADSRIPLERLGHALNNRLPDDIDVVDIAFAPDNFNAISGARRKQYRYRLFTAHRRPLEKRHHVFHCWTPLDLGRMRDAGARLVGTHDFNGLATASHGKLTTVRTLFRCDIEHHPLGLPDATVMPEQLPPPRPLHEVEAPLPPDFQPAMSNAEVHIVLEGDGFLYNMVRIIAGTLVEIGRGRFDPSQIDRILTECDRQLAGPTLPPNGLWLEWIEY